MAKFNVPKVRPQTASAVQTSAVSTGPTHQGGPGFSRDAKSELFLLAVTNMVGENTFYETGASRDGRYEALVRQVAVEDAAWTAKFVPWLRNTANMRSASLVAAAEAVHARLAGRIPHESFHDAGVNRKVIDAACQRADEPGELLAYWTAKYGRAIPKPVKRGLGDAVRRLYNEYSLLKYDTASHAVRFGDVLDLVHPAPADDKPWQGDLFRHALDRRHKRDKAVPESLAMVRRNALLRDAEGALERWLDPQMLREAGMTWEDALSAVGSKVDKAALWEAMIPSMGYMALLRNLRNFSQAEISPSAYHEVVTRLTDPEQVARSRQFPFRFLSAYQASAVNGQDLRWAWALEQALNHSLANVPSLPGRTLILVDRSGSMFGPVSEKSGLNRADTAALFGTALALRAQNADLVWYHEKWGPIALQKGASVLRTLEDFAKHGQGGTNTRGAVAANFRNHDRVVILTDEQTGSFGPVYAHPSGHQIYVTGRGWITPEPVGGVFQGLPKGTPCYTWNLAGYSKGHDSSGQDNHHTFGGLTDAAFRLIPLLEAGRSADWDAVFGSDPAR